MRLLFAAAVTFGLLPTIAEANCSDLQLEQLRRHVFKLVVSFPDGRRIQQTAFRAQGHDGLFTALHGVIGASGIEADRSEIEGQPLEAYIPSRNNALQIVRHHWEADLAFLRPLDSVFPEAGAGVAAGDGLEIDLSERYLTSGAPVGQEGCALGYPLGAEERQDHQVVFRSEVQSLDSLVGPTAENTAIRGYLSSVSSPYLGRKVLSIQSTMRQGDSGAPIVDAEARLVGFVDGGIGDGSLGLNWAIPLATTCFFANDADCADGAPSAAQVTGVEAAILRFAEGRRSMYSTAELRLPLEIGTVVTGPRTDPFLGPFREIEAMARLSACDVVELEIDMINRDKVFGFCMRPSVEIFGEDPLRPITPKNAAEVGNPASPGRLCLGSVLEDEAILRLWEMVTDPETATVLRQLLSVDDEIFAEIAEAREALCKARGPGIPCKPHRVEEDGNWEPPYVTVRGVQALIVSLPAGTCTSDGDSEVHEIRWVYTPSKKPDGIFEVLDRVEGLLKRASRLAEFGEVAELVLGALGKCSDDAEPAACALLELFDKAVLR